MSKTIEIVSRHIGPVALCTRRGEQRTVNFEDKGGRGFARCDEDEAEILLGSIGLPDYWKPGEGGPDGSTAATIPTGGENGRGDDNGGTDGNKNSGNDAEGDGGTPKLTKGVYEQIKNAAELQALLQTTEDTGIIMELIAIESQKDPSRATWMKALNDRLEAIKK